MQECVCGNWKMEPIIVDHTTTYHEIHWCRKCGTLLEILEDSEEWRKPQTATQPAADHKLDDAAARYLRERNGGGRNPAEGEKPDHGCPFCAHLAHCVCE